MKRPEILVNLRNCQRSSRISRRRILDFLQQAWQYVPARNIPQRGVPELSLILINNRRMRCYNRLYRKKDYPTDVLSFPVNEPTFEGTFYLGDIVISVEKALGQAQEKEHGLMTEICVLVLHGLLHVLEYDHETDSGQMSRLERRLWNRLVPERSAAL
jgi:probable rRNA maturation factor